MASIPEKLNQILANQKDAADREAGLLTAIQSIPGANTQAITDALARVEAATKDIQAQVDDVPVTPPTA